MDSVLISCVSCLLVSGVSPRPAAGSVFTIADPSVDFEVIDADDGSGEYFFDGIGDFGPFSTFNNALLGSFGEARSMAEFDISPFSVPPGESISGAVFEVKLSGIDVFGLGVDGEIPDGLTVDGYVADGLADLTDFQIGDGNTLDSVPTPAPSVGQVISFDVTSFIIGLVDAGEPFAGLTVRAGTFGGLQMEEGAGYPRLTIETMPEAACPADLDGSGDVGFSDLLALLGAWGPCPGCPADLDGSGDVGFSDLLVLLGSWGPCV